MKPVPKVIDAIFPLGVCLGDWCIGSPIWMGHPKMVWWTISQYRSEEVPKKVCYMLIEYLLACFCTIRIESDLVFPKWSSSHSRVLDNLEPTAVKLPIRQLVIVTIREDLEIICTQVVMRKRSDYLISSY